MLGVFAEFETNLRRERQLEGIAKAKIAGVYKGRRPTIDPAEGAEAETMGPRPYRDRQAAQDRAGVGLGGGVTRRTGSRASGRSEHAVGNGLPEPFLVLGSQSPNPSALLFSSDCAPSLTFLCGTTTGRQGTAAVILAGLLNALKVVNKIKGEARIVLIGVGAANVSVARVLAASGFPSGNLMLVDTKGILHREREDLRTPETFLNESSVNCQIRNRERAA
jgi:hypothetical protein